MEHMQFLPIELIYKITSYLDVDEVFACMGICKRWRDALNSDSIWKPLCLKVRIFDPVPISIEPKPLCPWAEAFYLYRCMPMQNWRNGKFYTLRLIREEEEFFEQAWDGHYLAIYYYTLGKINVYSIYDNISMKQVIKVPLPKKESYNNATIGMNDPYIIAARFNVAVIFKKSSVYTIFKTISVTDTFMFGHELKNRNEKISCGIAWGCLWMKAKTIKDTFVTNLKNDTTYYIVGKPYLAFNDNSELIIAWSKTIVRVLTTSGIVKLSIERDKIQAVDFDSKILVLKIENNLEIIDIKSGATIKLIRTTNKIDFALSGLLFILEGSKTSRLKALSTKGENLWSVEGLNGKPKDIRMIGSKYIFVVPSYSGWNFCLFDRKGQFLREQTLPDEYDEYPCPLYGETLPFLVVTTEKAFNILTFI